MTLQNYSLDESKKLNQFAVERGLSDSSKRKYKICLKRYITYFDMTLEDLIDEADNEEETIARENIVFYENNITYNLQTLLS